MSVDLAIAGTGEPYSELEVVRAHARIHEARRDQLEARGESRIRASRLAMTRALTDLYEAQPNEFHLSGGGVINLQTTMLRLGMLDVDTRHDPWPNPRAFGVNAQVMAEYAESGHEAPAVALFNAALDAVRDKQAENPVAIPLYKIKTNEGWLITPDEITAALGAYRTALGEGVPDPRLFWWPYWIAFLERAGERTGIRVH